MRFVSVAILCVAVLCVPSMQGTAQQHLPKRYPAGPYNAAPVQQVQHPKAPVQITNEAPPQTQPAPQQEETRAKFRRALVAAARRAASKGDITRRDAIRVRVASLSPAFLESAEELCIVQMVFSGEDAEHVPFNDDGTVDRTSINWEGLTAFLEAIIPLILELLLALGL